MTTATATTPTPAALVEAPRALLQAVLRIIQAHPDIQAAAERKLAHQTGSAPQREPVRL